MIDLSHGSAPLALLAALLAVALAISLLAWWRASTRIGRENRSRQVAARAGEVEAERLLRRAGYDIEDRQVTGTWEILVDGVPQEVLSRADLLVSRAGRRFVAEVKTGSVASDPRTPATRRQLLEYLLAFPVHGVILVDMQIGRIRRVDFPLLR